MANQHQREPNRLYKYVFSSVRIAEAIHLRESKPLRVAMAVAVEDELQMAPAAETVAYQEVPKKVKNGL
jgi:hypothetical protein